MSKKFTVRAEKREALGSAASRRLRRAGQIPAAVYGHGEAATAVTLTKENVAEMIHHPGLVEVKIPGRRQTASTIVRYVQQDPISGGILHLDLQEVKADEIISSAISVEPHGTPAGAHHGGVLQQAMHELEIRCLPADLPDTITVDVSDLELDSMLFVRDLPLPEGVTATSDPELVVFQVRLSRMDVPEEAEEAELETEGEEEEGAEAEESEAAGASEDDE